MKILGIGAHYDDLELGCSGTLIKHIKNNDEVTMMVIADSGYKNAKGSVVRDHEIAKEEGMKAAKIIGADLKCLDFQTHHVPLDETLTKQINDFIEDYEPDIVYSHWTGDLHRDHENVGKCTLMAARHVPRFLMYRSNFYDTEHQFRANFYSDISDVMDKKIEVIKAHKSELERVRNKWLDFFMKQHENDGQKIGVKYAECFEVVRFLI